MSYTINLTNGTTLIPGGLQDGTIDTTHTSLVLIGKDYAGYGEFINENFIKLLENFASTAGPATPLKGQLWWDETNNILRVWSGTTWKISTGATSSSVTNPPSDLSGLGGDLWFDSTNNQLKVYTGSQWITVGPVASTAVGNTGAVPTIMADTGFGSHIVIQFLFNGVVYAILSKDTFSSSLTGFPTVRSGLTFNNSVSPPLGLSTQDVNPTPSTLVQRDSTGGITATTIVGTAITASSITTSGPISGTFNGKVTGDVVASSISSSNITTGGITASSGYTGLLLTPNQPNLTGLGTVNNLTTSGATNLNGLAYYNGSLIATQGGSASFSSINNTPVGNAVPSTGAFTSLTVNNSIAPVTAANATISLGTPTQWFGTVYGKAIQATFADTAAVARAVTGLTSANVTTALGFTPVNSALLPSSFSGTTTAASGGGSLSYNNSNGVFTFTPASPALITSASITAALGYTPYSSANPNGFYSSGSAANFSSVTVNGSIQATGDITAYVSDDRLKTRLGTIENALDKVCALEGFYYELNPLAVSMGYEVKREVGVSAQSTQAQVPEIVAPAPVDNEYLTVKYEKFAPLFIEAIKELRAEIEAIKKSLN